MGRQSKVDYSVLELVGVEYAVLRVSVLKRLAARAGVELSGSSPRPAWHEACAGDAATLADRLAARRKGVGLTQAELARRAGVRVETVNRIERGKTTPDFATIRKLLEAVNEAEEANAGIPASRPDIRKRKRGAGRKE